MATKPNPDEARLLIEELERDLRRDHYYGAADAFKRYLEGEARTLDEAFGLTELPQPVVRQGRKLDAERMENILAGLVEILPITSGRKRTHTELLTQAHKQEIARANGVSEKTVSRIWDYYGDVLRQMKAGIEGTPAQPLLDSRGKPAPDDYRQAIANGIAHGIAKRQDKRHKKGD